MKRLRTERRPDWLSIVENQGLVFGTPALDPSGADRVYWDESVHYVFEMDEILALEADVELLHSMCLTRRRTRRRHGAVCGLRAARMELAAVAESWRRCDPHVYGRFDLRYDGRSPAKLLEYNADTPTTLLEASILQWHWLKDVLPDDDQWNSLHEKLVERWKVVRDSLPGDELHFTWSWAEPTGEDHVTTAYLQETAAEAGLDTIGLAIEDIGWDAALDRFVDLEEAPIAAMFKLYPWEWVLNDDFGKHVVRACRRPCGSSRCGRRCCPTRRCWRCCGRCTPATPTCCPPTSTSPACSPSTSASPGSAARAPTSRSSRPASRWPPAASTAKRATSTSCSIRCRSSTASGPRWARGSSATRPRAWASARPSGW